VIRVVRGSPTDEEVAAVVVALLRGPATPARPEPVSGWTRREDLLRKPLHPGPGAWRRPAW
jgi:hypothetical protein